MATVKCEFCGDDACRRTDCVYGCGWGVLVCHEPECQRAAVEDERRHRVEHNAQEAAA